jgi:hypothetical protein
MTLFKSAVTKYSAGNVKSFFCIIVLDYQTQYTVDLQPYLLSFAEDWLFSVWGFWEGTFQNTDTLIMTGRVQ